MTSFSKPLCCKDLKLRVPNFAHIDAHNGFNELLTQLSRGGTCVRRGAVWRDEHRSCVASFGEPSFCDVSPNETRTHRRAGQARHVAEGGRQGTVRPRGERHLCAAMTLWRGVCNFRVYALLTTIGVWVTGVGRRGGE